MLSSIFAILAYIAVIIGIVLAFHTSRKKQRKLLNDCFSPQESAPRHPAFWYSPKTLSESVRFGFTTIKKIPRQALISSSLEGIHLALEDASLGDTLQIKLPPSSCCIREIQLGQLAGRFSTVLELQLPKGRLFFLGLQRNAPSPRKTRAIIDALKKDLPSAPTLKIVSRWESCFIAVALACLAAILGALFFLSQRPAPSGPTQLTVPTASGWYAFNNDDLLAFDSQGHLADIRHGMEPRAAAILPDGSYYLMDRKVQQLMHCTGQQCTPMTLTTETPLDSTLSMTATPDGAFFVVSEPNEDRIRLFTRAGEEVQRLASPQHRLCFPNGLTFGNDGKLYVADTNLNRIAVFSFEQNTLKEDGEHLMVKDRPATAGAECSGGRAKRWIKRMLPEQSAPPLSGVRHGRVWPTDVAQLADGRWAVLLARNGMRSADLLIFDADWQKPQVINVPADSDIVAIKPWQDGLIAADMKTPGLFSLQKNKLMPWPDTEFQAWMENVTQQADQQKKWMLSTPVSLAAFLIIIIFCSMRMTQKKLKCLIRMKGSEINGELSA